MKTIPTNLAFPLVALGVAEEIGLTKREWFAGMALSLTPPDDEIQSLRYREHNLARARDDCQERSDPELRAEWRKREADALIAELNRETK